jgi:hypothetical protein
MWEGSMSAGTQKHTPVKLTYGQVIEWAKSANGRVSIGVNLGPITVGQLVQLIHDQHCLIASAPELLEFAALVARMRTLEEFGDDAPQQDDWIETLGELIASARAIVAKATGATVVAGAQP